MGGVRGAEGKGEGRGAERAIDEKAVDDAKAKDAAGHAADPALDVTGSESSGSSYQRAITGGNLGVGRGHATQGSGVHGGPPIGRWDFTARSSTPAPTKEWFGNLFQWAADRLFAGGRTDFSDEPTQPDILAVGARLNPFADPAYVHETTVLDRMMAVLGLTGDSYVYRASRPQWIRNGAIGLNHDSVARVQDPYGRPELLTDIERAYNDLDAADALFESMWDNGMKAADLDRPGLNVSSDAASIIDRYGGGPGDDRILIRFRLGDVPDARVYPDIGGGAGDKSILYVTGEGGPVPVEIYDHATGSWIRPADIRNSRNTEESMRPFGDILSVDAVRAEPYDIAAARNEGLTEIPVGQMTLTLKEGADIEAVQDAVLRSMPEGMSLLIPESELGYLISTGAKLVFGVPGSPDLRFVVNIESYPSVIVSQ